MSDTAFWVASFRALETDSPDAVFRDPLARVLVGSKGDEIAQSLGGARTWPSSWWYARAPTRGAWPRTCATSWLDRADGALGYVLLERSAATQPRSVQWDGDGVLGITLYKLTV